MNGERVLHPFCIWTVASDHHLSCTNVGLFDGTRFAYTTRSLQTSQTTGMVPREFSGTSDVCASRFHSKTVARWLNGSQDSSHSMGLVRRIARPPLRGDRIEHLAFDSWRLVVLESRRLVEEE
jgi:hypothetical protein